MCIGAKQWWKHAWGRTRIDTQVVVWTCECWLTENVQDVVHGQLLKAGMMRRSTAHY